MAPAGMFLNTNKTRILTNTNGTSSISILAIHQQYGPTIADSIQTAIATFSTKPTPTPSDPTLPQAPSKLLLAFMSSANQ
jgi:hypothetical protein